MLEQIVEGKSVTHQIKFIEGWTFDDYLEQLRSKPNLEQTLLDLDNDAILEKLGIAENLEKLGIAESHPEGLFFPGYLQLQLRPDRLFIVAKSQPGTD